MPGTSTLPDLRAPRTVLGTVCIPWTPDRELDVPRFRRTITTLVERGMPDLYVFGTAGEGHAVSERQFRRIVEVFVDAMSTAGGAEPMVGLIGLSLGTILERLRWCEAIGVRSFQFSLTPWGTADEQEARAIVDAICGGSPDSRFLHYNLPRAGRLVAPHEYAQWIDAYPNLVATKYGAGDHRVVAGLLREAPQLTHYLSEQGYYLGAPLGPCAIVASAASIRPSRARRYLDAGASGDPVEFAALYRELVGVTRALLDAVGPGRIDGAYDKVLARMHDPEFPLDLLPPWTPATESAYRAFRDAVARDYPEWIEQEHAE